MATALGWPVRSISRRTRWAIRAGTRVRLGPLASEMMPRAARSFVEVGWLRRMVARTARLPGRGAY